jgi:hypothetical protein
MHCQVKNTLKNNRNHTPKQKKKLKEKRERGARTLHSHPLFFKKKKKKRIISEKLKN